MTREQSRDLPKATPDHRVTLADVARKARVSQSTVSRALRGNPRISARTQKRIIRASEALQYVPNNAARSLVTRTSGVFGLLIPDMSDPFYGQVATGFEQESMAEGYTVIIANVLGDPAQERSALRLFASHGVDGIAVVSSLQAPAAVWMAVRPSPVVFIAAENPRIKRGPGTNVIGGVLTDQAGGMRSMVQHLAEQGYRRLAYIN